MKGQTNMNVINEYHISELDLSKLERYILEHGTLRTVNKKEYLLKQNDRNAYIGFISRGMFRYTRIDNLGNATKGEQVKLKIFVTDIRPGFVDTAMAKGNGLFWVAPVEKASKQICTAIQKKKKIVYITRRWKFIAQILN